MILFFTSSQIWMKSAAAIPAQGQLPYVQMGHPVVQEHARAVAAVTTTALPLGDVNVSWPCYFLGLLFFDNLLF